MDRHYPSGFPQIWKHLVERDKLKSSSRGSAKVGIAAFKKKLDISSRPCPCNVLNVRIAVVTCSDSMGVNKKVTFVALTS